VSIFPTPFSQEMSFTCTVVDLEQCLFLSSSTTCLARVAVVSDVFFLLTLLATPVCSFRFIILTSAYFATLFLREIFFVFRCFIFLPPAHNPFCVLLLLPPLSSGGFCSFSIALISHLYLFLPPFVVLSPLHVILHPKVGTILPRPNSPPIPGSDLGTWSFSFSWISSSWIAFLILMCYIVAPFSSRTFVVFFFSISPSRALESSLLFMFRLPPKSFSASTPRRIFCFLFMLTGLRAFYPPCT